MEDVGAGTIARAAALRLAFDVNSRSSLSISSILLLICTDNAPPALALRDMARRPIHHCPPLASVITSVFNPVSPRPPIRPDTFA